MVNITPQSLDVYSFLWAAVLIFFMKAGFTLLEIGQIRRKNVGVHMTLKFMDMSVVLIAYLFLGYAISYGMQFVGGVLAPGGVGVGSYAHYMKMVMFAVATVTIITGAVAERIKINGYVERLNTSCTFGIHFKLRSNWQYFEFGNLLMHLILILRLCILPSFLKGILSGHSVVTRQ